MSAAPVNRLVTDEMLGSHLCGRRRAQWLLEQNILAQRGENYGLVDEFLRVRLFEEVGRQNRS